MVKKYFSGFTLVELMIVLAIIAILAALVISFFSGQILKGNDAKRKGDIDRIKIAAEEYEKDNNCYPPFITCGVNSGDPIYPYLNNVPCDPVTHHSYEYTNDGLTCPAWFKIYTVLENVQDTSVTIGIGPYGDFNYTVASGNAPSEAISTPVPSSSSGPTSTPGSTLPPEPKFDKYGCKNFTCVLLLWDSTRPGSECDPNYGSSSCYGRCVDSQDECIPWR